MGGREKTSTSLRSRLACSGLFGRKKFFYSFSLCTQAVVFFVLSWKYFCKIFLNLSVLRTYFISKATQKMSGNISLV